MAIILCFSRIMPPTCLQVDKNIFLGKKNKVDELASFILKPIENIWRNILNEVYGGGKAHSSKN